MNVSLSCLVFTASPSTFGLGLAVRVNGWRLPIPCWLSINRHVQLMPKLPLVTGMTYHELIWTPTCITQCSGACHSATHKPQGTSVLRFLFFFCGLLTFAFTLPVTKYSWGTQSKLAMSKKIKLPVFNNNELLVKMFPCIYSLANNFY